MGYRFITADRDQPFLLPVSIRDWLPEDHLVWAIIDAVEQMDLSAFERSYRADGQGAAPYDPRTVVTLLVYCLAVGVRSSRAVERATWTDVAARVITGNQVIDHATIARFLRRHRPAIKDLFVATLALCATAGLARVGLVAVDGYKVGANASGKANRTGEQLGFDIAALEVEVEAALAQIAEADASQDALFGQARRGDELPAWLARKAARLTRFQTAKGVLDQRVAELRAEAEARLARAQAAAASAAERLARERARQQAKIEAHQARAAQAAARGAAGAGGTPPCPVDEHTHVRRAAQAAENTRKRAAQAAADLADLNRAYPPPHQDTPHHDTAEAQADAGEADTAETQADAGEADTAEAHADTAEAQAGAGEADTAEAKADATEAGSKGRGKGNRGKRPRFKLPRANTTDPDSRVLQNKNAYMQGLTAQVVSNIDQIILSIDVFDSATDTQWLHPSLAGARDNCDRAGITARIRAALADSGYASRRNFTTRCEPILLVATTNEARQTGRSAGQDTTRASHQKMASRLATPAGQALYKRRSWIVEPVIGRVLALNGRHARARGLPGIRAEITVAAATHNILKLITRTHPTATTNRSPRAARPATA